MEWLLSGKEYYFYNNIAEGLKKCLVSPADSKLRVITSVAMSQLSGHGNFRLNS